MTRKPIQITSTYVDGYIDHNLPALCDDGTIWEYLYDSKNQRGSWRQLEAIPQDTHETAEAA